MTCVHLKKLFQLCEENQLRFSSADLVHVVCDQCQHDEVCPTLLMDQYETQHPESESEGDGRSDSGPKDSAE